MMLRACGSSFERSNSTYGAVRAAVGQIGYERFRRNRAGKTPYCDSKGWRIQQVRRVRVLL
jgi:hypothetical protein